MTNMQTMKTATIKAMISRVLEEEDFDELNVTQRRDIAFHLTDWRSDLERLVALYQAPEKFSTDEASAILMGFLMHAPNHLAAAAKLMVDMPVTDIFEVGATAEINSEDVQLD